jgi:hypothetical protein
MTQQTRLNLSWAAIVGSVVFSVLLVASALAAANHSERASAPVTEQTSK